MLDAAPQALDKDIVKRSSVLIVISSRLSTPVKASLVNCMPWSLSNTSGLACSCIASCMQSTQNIAFMVLLMRQLNTLREYSR
jgi:hypothetical protein